MKSSPQSDQALADLCQTYWYPFYAYVRRQGQSREDAEDLTQAFFARFLQKNYLEGLRSDRGKFRTFMLACMKHFSANEWDKNTRQKRGGTAQHLSLDWQSADERYHLEPADRLSPDVLYDREWALALLELVITRLNKEYSDAGKGELFEHAKGFLMGTGEVCHMPRPQLISTWMKAHSELRFTVCESATARCSRRRSRKPSPALQTSRTN